MSKNPFEIAAEQAAVLAEQIVPLQNTLRKSILDASKAYGVDRTTLIAEATAKQELARIEQAAQAEAEKPLIEQTLRTERRSKAYGGLILDTVRLLPRRSGDGSIEVTQEADVQSVMRSVVWLGRLGFSTWVPHYIVGSHRKRGLLVVAAASPEDSEPQGWEQKIAPYHPRVVGTAHKLLKKRDTAVKPDTMRQAFNEGTLTYRLNSELAVNMAAYGGNWDFKTKGITPTDEDMADFNVFGNLALLSVYFGVENQHVELLNKYAADINTED